MVSLRGKACHPGPIQEIRVPGTGNGAHLLNVPAIMSHLIRRTVRRILAPVCRHRFSVADCNFHPGENYRSTLQETRGVISRNCECMISLSLRHFFSAMDRDGLVRVLDRAVGSKEIIDLVRGCLHDNMVGQNLFRADARNAPRNNPLDPLLDGVVLGRLSGRLRDHNRPFIHCTSSTLVFYGSGHTTRHIGRSVAQFVRKRLFLGIGHRGAIISCIRKMGFLNCSFCMVGNGYLLAMRPRSGSGVGFGLGRLADHDGK